MSLSTTTKPCVFIVSSFVEPNVNAVISRLEKRNVRWVRFNTETFPLLTQIHLDIPTSDAAYGHFRFPKGVSNLDTRDVTAVWYRRSGNLILPDGLSVTQQEFVKSEALSLLLSTYDCMNCLWVNPRRLEMRAGLKPYQASVAKEVGLSIPETLVTNDADAVREFAHRFSEPILFKPIGGMIGGTPPGFTREVHDAYEGRFPVKPAPPSEREEKRASNVLFAQLLTPDKMAHIDSIIGCPAIFQEYIKKQVELRITIVGEEIFAAEIHSQTSIETQVDFRRMALYDRATIPQHAIHRLPDDVRDALMALMRRLGLVFGCIDMILTPDGRYVFLEVNSSGQWQWIEELTGMPITDALTDLLIRG